jgi:hypothetical protein
MRALSRWDLRCRPSWGGPHGIVRVSGGVGAQLDVVAPAAKGGVRPCVSLSLPAQLAAFPGRWPLAEAPWP